MKKPSFLSHYHSKSFASAGNTAPGHHGVADPWIVMPLKISRSSRWRDVPFHPRSLKRNPMTITQRKKIKIKRRYLILIVYNDSRLGSFRFHPILLISNPDAIGKSIPGQDRNKRWRHSALTEAVNHESSDLQVHCQRCTITIRRQSFKEFA